MEEPPLSKISVVIIPFGYTPPYGRAALDSFGTIHIPAGNPGEKDFLASSFYQCDCFSSYYQYMERRFMADTYPEVLYTSIIE